jgi:uncharacterized protein (UPF0332 family)
MPYERLLSSGRIKPYSAQPTEIQQLLRVATRDLNTAENNLNDAPDWAFSIAYNAVLQASHAIMLKEGFRSRGAEQHRTVVEFMDEKLGPAYSRQVRLFDQMRRKRNRVIYEAAGLVSKTEAEQAITFAKGFVEEMNQLILGKPS